MLKVFTSVTKELDKKAQTLLALESALEQGKAKFVTPERITVLRDKWVIFNGKCSNM